jgi:hypothetical protein
VVVSYALGSGDSITFSLSPDNATYSTLGDVVAGAVTETITTIQVPAGWYLEAVLTGGATIVSVTYY